MDSAQHLRPPSSLLFMRGIRRGWTALVRDRRWSTTFGVMLGIALLVQLTGLVAVALWSGEAMLRSQTDVRLQMKRTADDQSIQDFFGAVRALPIVSRATYITADQAYEQERKRDPETVAFLEQFNLQNPFADTISITLKSLDDYQTLVSFVTKPEWTETVDPAFLSSISRQEDQVRELTDVGQTARSLAIGFAAFILIILLFTVTELMRVRSHERFDEIVVERLVGAQNFYIFLPFAVEAGSLLFLAFIVASAVTVFLLWLTPTFIPAFDLGGVFFAFRSEVLHLLQSIALPTVVTELIIILAVALIGAWMGIREKVRTKHVF